MKKGELKWEILDEGKGTNIIDVLLKNRGILTTKQKKDFLEPTEPQNLGLKELDLSEKSINKAVSRIKTAIKNGEEIVIYGDYDADGICSTAILWEALYSVNKKVIPYIPDRFSEGYGINAGSIENIKTKYPKLKLIITVDNGIVAFDAVKKANELGIDVIITDHHQKDSKLPKAYSIIHTTKIAGSGVAWIFSREIKKHIKGIKNDGLELAAIGTIADQLPLQGPNRSIAKFGLMDLNQTKRPGVLALFEEAGIKKGNIGTYEINYLIAPRLNAMGRLEHAIDSLRLLCTRDINRSLELARHIGSINRQRQKVVDEVLQMANKEAEKETKNAAIVISGNYHEGVIGLAAGKLVESFGRPSIVFSIGEKTSKASARSIPGFNIISEIKKLKSLLLGAGGHPMAAGLSIKTENIEKFKEKFQKNTLKLLSKELLVRHLKIDTTLNHDQINDKLLEQLEELKPFGVGNPSPTFLTKKAKIISSKAIGSDMKHLKIVLKIEDLVIDSIAFNFGYLIKIIKPKQIVDVVYALEENIWNGSRSLQLKAKDIHFE